jgi:hypothetical protein
LEIQLPGSPRSSDTLHTARIFCEAFVANPQHGP